MNIGESLEMLSGGFYKATIHRVVQPPADQRGRTRLGAYYFALADDAVKLVPVASPVVAEGDVVRKFADDKAPTMGEWRRMRYMAYGLKKAVEGDVESQEKIVDNGVLVLKYYN